MKNTRRPRIWYLLLPNFFIFFFWRWYQVPHAARKFFQNFLIKKYPPKKKFLRFLVDLIPVLCTGPKDEKVTLFVFSTGTKSPRNRRKKSKKFFFAYFLKKILKSFLATFGTWYQTCAESHFLRKSQVKSPKSQVIFSKKLKKSKSLDFWVTLGEKKMKKYWKKSKSQVVVSVAICIFVI